MKIPEAVTVLDVVIMALMLPERYCTKVIDPTGKFHYYKNGERKDGYLQVFKARSLGDLLDKIHKAFMGNIKSFRNETTDETFMPPMSEFGTNNKLHLYYFGDDQVGSRKFRFINEEFFCDIAIVLE